MKKATIIFSFMTLVVVGLVFLLVYKSDRALQVKSTQYLNVVCTTSLIADAVGRVGGENVSLQALMGPGVDPHLYHARESDVQRLAEADIIFYNGLHLEGKMGQLFEKIGRTKPVYAVADALDANTLRSSGFEGLYDPHIWFDVNLWMQVVTGIRDRLIEHDPDNKALYHGRAALYLKELSELDAHVRKQAQKIPEKQRILITAHDAYEYFGQAYGFKVVGLQGISTDSQVGTRDVMRLVDIIVENNVTTIFAEASIPLRNIEAVQKAVQARGKKVIVGPELYSDTLGEPGTAAQTYVGMIRYTIDTLVKALV